jgi:hypothetical protein
MSRLIILGHGITVDQSFTLAPGITISPEIPLLDMQAVAEGSEKFSDYAAVLAGHKLANFSLDIEDRRGAKELAVKSWNALWQFHLLSLACSAPCCSLYSTTLTTERHFSSANRNIMMRPFDEVKLATPAQLKWALDHQIAFDKLTHDSVFSAAMRCYGNSHYLFDLDMRIMLLWSGIEGLLSVDAEISRRLALYAALMLRGSSDEKLAFFDKVKKAYSVRSKVVHGGALKPEALKQGYLDASQILVQLLARCVELGRVPLSEEMDALAICSTVN